MVFYKVWAIGITHQVRHGPHQQTHQTLPMAYMQINDRPLVKHAKFICFITATFLL